MKLSFPSILLSAVRLLLLLIFFCSYLSLFLKIQREESFGPILMLRQTFAENIHEKKIAETSQHHFSYNDRKFFFLFSFPGQDKYLRRKIIRNFFFSLIIFKLWIIENHTFVYKGKTMHIILYFLELPGAQYFDFARRNSFASIPEKKARNNVYNIPRINKPSTRKYSPK